MQKMMRTATAATAAAAMAILLSACGGSPTGGTDVKATGPSYDGGFTMGSGNREVPTDSTTGTDNDPTTQSTQGYTVGSGN
ncbi:MAG TPA: hypothetical protein VF142_12770 [Longimicrobium sp.]